MDKIEKFFEKIENIFNSKYGNIYAYGIVLILCFFIMLGQNFRLEAGNDDVYHTKAVENFGSAYKFMIAQYENTNGRYFTSLVMSFVMDKNIWLWRILNTFVLFGLIYYSFKNIRLFYNFDNKKNLILFFAIFSMFALFKNDIINWSVTWVTGSFNYLWSATSLVISLYYIMRYSINNIKLNFVSFIILIPIVVYACNVEQSALILITIFIISIIYSLFKYRKYDLLYFILFLICLISVFILFTSPSIPIRYEAEIKTWYPMFSELSILEKVIYGFSYTVLYGFILKNYALSMILSFLLYYVLKKQYNNKVNNVLLIVILFYTLIYYIFDRLKVYAIDSTWFYNIVKFSRQVIDTSPSESYFSFILLSFFFIILSYSIFKIKYDILLNYFLMLLFFGAAVMSAFILSFSPTIYDSGARIWFIPSTMYVIGAGIIFAELLKYIDITSIKFKIVFFIICIISIIDIISKVYM